MNKLRSRPHPVTRLTSLLVLFVSVLRCGNSEQGHRGDSSADASGAGATMQEADAGTGGGSGSGGADGGTGVDGSAGTLSVDPPGAFDGGACESYPAPLLRSECPDTPEPGEPCEPPGLPCLFEDPSQAGCFRHLECSGTIWSERSVCRDGTSEPTNNERCPEDGPVEGEPCEHAELVCDFGPCGAGKISMECQCGRWKTQQGCVVP